MMNQMLEVLSDVPPMLSAGWLAWFLGGAMLMVWYRKAKAAADLEPAVVAPVVSRAKTVVRPASGEQSLSGVRTARPASEAPRHAPEPKPMETPAPVAAKPKVKPAHIVVGDPFGELATLLDQPGGQETSSFRTPGDSPILNSAGTPLPKHD